MKNFLVLVVFVSTMLFGLIISDSFDYSAKFDNYLHPNCARWEGEIIEKPLFTLNELKQLNGKKVISLNDNFDKKGEIGKVIHFEMVGQDKFLVAIYWGNGAEDKDSYLTFHGKEGFSEDFRVVD